MKETGTHGHDCQDENFHHHTEMVKEQWIYWHLGHETCLEVLCHICYKQMPEGIWLLSRWLCWESILYIWFFESVRPSVEL